MELTIEMVREWLAGNKETDEVKAFLKEIGAPDAPELTAETVGEWLKGDEGQALLQPIVDRRVTEAVKTHDTKVQATNATEIKRRVAEEMLRLNPQETPEQKQIRELREEVATEKKSRERDTLKRAIVEEAARQQIPSWWVDEYSGNSLEEAKVFLSRVKTHSEEIATRAKNELLASGYKPGSGNGQQTKPKVDASKLSLAEAIKLEEEGTLNDAVGLTS